MICLPIIFIIQQRPIYAEEQCLLSLSTIETISSCPSNEAELLLAKRRKPCEHIADIQNCTKRDKFKYHCVLNAWENKTVAVCAPEIISQGFCLKFDEGDGRLQELYDRDCTNHSKPCKTRFSSSNVLHYLQCNDVPRRKNESANNTVQTEDHESTNETVQTNHQTANDSLGGISKALLIICSVGFFFIFIIFVCLTFKRIKGLKNKRQQKKDEQRPIELISFSIQ